MPGQLVPQWASSLLSWRQAMPQQVPPAPQLAPWVAWHCQPVAAVQARQTPEQAPAQHRLFTQKPDMQSPPATHWPPLGALSGGTQLPPMQLGVEPEQARVSVMHVPDALQTFALTEVPLAHVNVSQVVPAAFRRQPPLPSQPSEQALSLHVPSVAPTGRFAQVPSWPATAQDLHEPPQALAQQRPC